MITASGKVSFFIGNSSKKSQALFSSSYDPRTNRSPAKDGHEQTRGH